MNELPRNWKEQLNYAVREIRQVQTALWFGILALILSLIISFIYDIPKIPDFVRYKLLPGCVVGLLAAYVGILFAWVVNVVHYWSGRRQVEYTKSEALTLSEKGNLKEKSFSNIVLKINRLLGSAQQKGLNLPNDIIFISCLDDRVTKEINELKDIADKYELKLKWYITEDTPIEARSSLCEHLRNFLFNSGNAYLTGELPIFDELLVVPGVIVVVFMKDNWFSWVLTGLPPADVNEIKEKVELTPFSWKIKQFFGKENVHRAISSYLSELISLEGFVIGAEHSYFWIREPERLFEEITNYQEVINEKFEEVSDELRQVATVITANLPLIDNYKAITDDPKIEEWLTELKQEAQKRGQNSDTLSESQTLEVDRYIYLRGDLKDERWVIKKDYNGETCNFLKKDFFSNLPSNYRVWVVLFDERRVKEAYQSYKSSSDVAFPAKEIISNWIWFECENSYHVLQYEMGLKIEDIVAEKLGEVLGKDKSELSKISVFKFADAMYIDSQKVLKKYQDYRNFLRYLRETSFVLDLQGFLCKYCCDSC